jgi:membrane-bound inhibitor of C-type lysozyme
MANTIRIKRRSSAGAAGAPSSLENAELAYNEADDTLYYGKGTGGAGGTATTVEAIAGAGAYVTLGTNQSITGNKTFSGTTIVPTPTANTHAATKLYVDNAVAGATITITGTENQIAVAGTTISLAANITTPGNLTVTGDLTVQGNTTTLNTATLTVEDKNIVLANVSSASNTTADGAGITVTDGSTGKTFNWVNATAAWTSSEDLNLLAGKVFEIGGTSVLSNTTLGSTVVNSSLTSVGTIATGVWNGTAIGTTYGGTGLTSYTTGDLIYSSSGNTLSKLGIGSAGQFLKVVAGVPAWSDTVDGGTF